MDLRAIAKDKLSFEAIRGDSRAQVIGGGAAGLAVLAVVLVLVLTMCSGSSSGDTGAGGQDEPPRSEAVVEVTPEDGAKGVGTEDALRITAAKGRLTEVTVTDADGKEVEGEISDGGTSWEPDSHLRTGTEYAVSAVAKDKEGLATTERATFTTLEPEKTFIGHFTPEDGDTVGAGMPVSLNFDRPITDRKAVEEAISVTAEPDVPVEGHWFGNQRLDFRPEKYWAAGTEVTLDLDLDGVEGADGVYGKQKKSIDFEIGRRQVSVVDAAKKTMTVTRDGKKLKTLPISSGTDANPTYNGKMVISERLKETRMDGSTVGFGRDESTGGYDIPDVPHAMRLSTSGTFIHGNYWTARSSFGRANLSHGCIGLWDVQGAGDPSTPAAWFYDHSMIGDIVEIKNSKDETIQPDNGLNGWNMSWEKWTAEQD